jgi:hypothetical protein
LASQFGRLIGKTVPGIWIVVPQDWLDPAITRSWLDTLHWGQNEAKAAIEHAAQKKPWKLEMFSAARACPRFDMAGNRSVGVLGNSADRRLSQDRLAVSDQRNTALQSGWRIRRCVKPNCNAVLVGRTTSRYCDRHSTSAEKSRRFRERAAKTLTP